MKSNKIFKLSNLKIGAPIFLRVVVLSICVSCNKNDFTQTMQSESVSVSDADAATAVTVNSNLIFQEDFEGSSYFPTSGTAINKVYTIENCATDWTLSTVTNPVFLGKKVSRFEIRKDQPLVGTGERIRSEVAIIKGSSDTRFTPNIWYSFAVLFPSTGMEYDDRRDCINQWFEDGSDETTLRVEKDKAFIEVCPPKGSKVMKIYDLFAQKLTTLDGTVSSFVTIPKNTWHEFVFHFIHSLNDDGLIEIWRDGVKILNINGRNMHAKYPKWKIGLYKTAFLDGTSNQYSRVINFDNIRVGKASSTLSDMSSSVTVATNQPPTADAGNDLTIILPDNTVTLSGSASDPEGFISSTIWTKSSGPSQFTFSNANILNPIVSNLTEGTYIFRLTVTDNKGLKTTNDVNVIVSSPPVTSSLVKSFTIINAESDLAVVTMTDGGTYSLSQLGISSLNIRANISGTTGSIKFELSGQQTKTTYDSAIPYAVQGDNGKGNYWFGDWDPPPAGKYTLKATPYTGSKGTGKASTPATIHYTLTK